jgi:hypothetical protein
MKQAPVRMGVYLPIEVKEKIDKLFLYHFQSGDRKSFNKIVVEALEEYFERKEKK